jgi:hypothetical protein
MNKTSRWAAIVGVVCGAELVAVAVIGGAGIAAFVNIEAAIVAAVLAGVTLWAIDGRRRRKAASHGSAAPPSTKGNNSEADGLASAHRDQLELASLAPESVLNVDSENC